MGAVTQTPTDALSQQRLFYLLAAGTVMVFAFLVAMVWAFTGSPDTPFSILQPIWYSFTVVTAGFILAINIPFFGRWVQAKSG